MNGDNLKSNDSLYKSTYMQLYSHFKEEILAGRLSAGTKLPSLRNLAKDMGISTTTTQLAYDQLLVEGYIYSKPQSGYYVSPISAADTCEQGAVFSPSGAIENYHFSDSPYLYDPDSFDFVKWKKCITKVLNDYPYLLFFESDPQGEELLRMEISKYLFSSRGVSADPSHIVIGAGTQQITSHLARILSRMEIKLVSLEYPGYLPVHRMFIDSGFNLSHIPVSQDGINIELLPKNIPSVAYVNPSNQFPTGAIMPVGRRYQLLQWARDNDSIIIEDDYDSELRYFGKPVPAMQGLDNSGRVVYLGSFSSTLFPAIKIAYMVLPENMAQMFYDMKDSYTQTCSKAEQLTLAFFMEQGHYMTGIRRLRNLNSQKLQTVLSSIEKYGGGLISPVNSNSGINIILKVRTKKTAEVLCKEAKSLGLLVVPLSDITDQNTSGLLFYYSQLPLNKIDGLMKELSDLWK